MFLLQLFSSYRFSRYIKFFFLFWDVVTLNAAFVAGVYARHWGLSRLDDPESRAVLILSNFLWLGLVLYKDAYVLMRFERIEKMLGRTIRLLLIHAMAVALFVIFLKYEDLSRLHLLYFYLFFGIGLIVIRLGLTRALKYARSKGYNYRKVIVVGRNEVANKMVIELESDLSLGYRVVAQFGEREEAPFTDSDSLRHFGRIEELESFLASQEIHEMYVALNADKPEIIRHMIFLAEKYMLRIKFIPHFYSYTKTRRVSIDFYGNIPIMMLRKEPLEIWYNRILKKGFDLFFSLFVIFFIFSWLFPILIILVKWSSPGPAFFKQLRTGEDNNEFTCLKFRTMRVNALSDELQASSGDPRITTIGRIMRKTNLDELPQFFNVFTGSMSVVGPRPHMLKHTEQYSALIDNYLVRHFAKPGITGWAQVNGYRGETKELIDMQNRVEYDIWYIENWSFLLDLKIIWLTVWNMIRGEKNAV